MVVRWKKALPVVLLVLIGIQFVPVDRSNPPVEQKVDAPAPVLEVLRRACYDCHSNRTRWPWYSYVAPVSWLVADDVHEAREHVNFSTWNRYRPSKQDKIAREVWEEVEEGDMPPWQYLLLHPEARLSEADRKVLRAWAIDHGAELDDEAEGGA